MIKLDSEHQVNSLVKRLVCFRNWHQDFPGYCVTFCKGSWKSDQILRYRRFSFTIMRKKLLEFFLFLFQ